MEFSNYTMQSICFCNLLREVGCSLACVGGWDNSCHPELLNICRPELVSGPNPRGIDIFNAKQFLNKFYTLLVGKMLNILDQLKTPHFMLQHDMYNCEHSEAIHNPQESRGVKCQ